MEKVKIYANLEKVVARTADVDAALRRQAAVIASSAQAELSRHRKTGEHHIERTKGLVDHYVNLVGPAALSVEEGWLTDDLTLVPGLHIMRKAGGL